MFTGFEVSAFLYQFRIKSERYNWWQRCTLQNPFHEKLRLSFMSLIGVSFWLVWFGVLTHVVAMDSFDSGLFSSCSTPAPKTPPTNPFRPGNPFRSEKEENTTMNASIFFLRERPLEQCSW